MFDEQGSVLDQILERLLADLQGRPEFDESVMVRLRTLAAAERLDQYREVLEALAGTAARQA